MMRVGHVIYFSSAGCSLWSWRDTRFLANPVATAVGADPGPVVMELGRLEPAPVAILVDMIDEEHARDAVPRLGRGDRRALLERKLARAFPRTNYRAAQVQGRNPAKPDEDRVLLSALTRPEPLRMLMQRLADARVPVAGVYSPALLAARLLDEETRSASAVFLVLRRSNGRMQHAFFRDGELAGSRRLRAAAVSAEENPGLYVAQVEESLRYFDPSFAASATEPLLLLLPPSDIEALNAAAVCGEGWQLRALSPAGLRKRLHVRAVVGESDSERLFIELLRKPPRAANFAPGADQRYFRLFSLRSFAKAACLATAGAAIAGTLYNALIIADAQQRAENSSTTSHALENVLPDPSDLLEQQVDPLQMRDAVIAYEALRANRADPPGILAAVAAAVTRRPRIRIDSVQWGPAGATTETQDMDSAAEDSPAAGPAAGLTVRIKGHVAPFDGVYPLAFDELQAFVAALQDTFAVEQVRPTEEPLDISPGSTLSGELTPGGAVPQASFEVEVVMKDSHETV